MRSAGLLLRLGRFGAVGVLAAVVHLAVLISLEMLIPSWLANPLAFLAASVAGYLGHSLLTFREETGGRRFARRWLILSQGACWKALRPKDPARIVVAEGGGC